MGTLPAISKLAHYNDMTKIEKSTSLILSCTFLILSVSKRLKGNSLGVSEQPESHCTLHHDLLGEGT